MSKLARKPIIIPEKVQVEIKDNTIEVRGPLGKVIERIQPKIKVQIENSKIFVIRSGSERTDKMYQGLVWSLIKNAVIGVTEGFKKQLEIRGVGYQAQAVNDTELVLRLGFSHPVKFKSKEDVKLSVDPKGTIITVFGVNKQLVGETAAMIRRIKPPDSYKGMGIRYLDEKVIKKAGKTAVTAAVGAKK